MNLAYDVCPACQSEALVFDRELVACATCRTLTRGPRRQHLRPLEFRFARALLLRQGLMLSLGDIISAVWEDPDQEPGSIENNALVHLCRLRPKLAALGYSMNSKNGRRTYRLEHAPEALEAAAVAEPEAIEAARRFQRSEG